MTCQKCGKEIKETYCTIINGEDGIWCRACGVEILGYDPEED